MNAAPHRHVDTSHSPAKMLLIVSSAAVVGCVMTGVFMVWLMSAAEPAPVTADDKGFLFPVAELHSTTAPWIIRLEAEQYSKKRFQENHVELTYSYQHPLEDLELLVTSQIVILPAPAAANRRAAELTRKFQNDGGPLQKTVDRTGLFPPEQDTLYLVRTIGGTTAAHFLLHKNKRGLLLIEVTGNVIEPWEFAEAAKRYINNFEVYLARFE